MALTVCTRLMGCVFYSQGGNELKVEVAFFNLLGGVLSSHQVDSVNGVCSGMDGCLIQSSSSSIAQRLHTTVR